jgi:hypothetical protein
MAGNARYTALLDACVLYPLAMTDALVRCHDAIRVACDRGGQHVAIADSANTQ